ncbi:MAG TPA: ATP-dependent helicase, partial [Archangium sp.]
LEGRIDQRMTETRATLLERFDGDVRKKLRVAGDAAREAVSKRKLAEKSFTGSVLGTAAVGRRQLALAAKEVRARTNDAFTTLVLDGSTLPAKIGNLQGKEGWWYAYRFELTGLKPEERLVHIVCTKYGEGYRVIPYQDAELLTKAQAREDDGRKPAPNLPTLEHEKALMAVKDELTRLAERRNMLELDAAKDRADRFAEDCLFSPRQQVDRARAEWEEARKVVLTIEDPTERVKARSSAERLEREYRRKLTQLRQAEDAKYAEKDRTLAALAAKAKVVVNRTMVASSYFWIE